MRGQSDLSTEAECELRVCLLQGTDSSVPFSLQDRLGRLRCVLLVFALGVGALPHGSGLEPFFDHVGAAALRTLFGNRFAPRHEIAVGPSVAAIEGLAALGTPLHHFALAALRALDPDGLLLDVLARRVIAASGELAVAAGLEHQIVAALRALLIERLIGFLLLPADLLRGLAIGISGACQERSEPAFFQDHRPAAVLAIFFVALLGQIDFVDIRQVDRQLARVGALGIAGARDEAAVLAPLDHQALAALRTRDRKSTRLNSSHVSISYA